jgi:hypothetical protein
MRRRIPKTPATVIGDKMRKAAVAFKADGQDERAEGYIDCANMVDAWLFAETKLSPDDFKLSIAGSEAVRGPLASTQAGSIEERLAALEENLGNLAALVAAGARKPEPALNRPREMPSLLRPPVKTKAPPHPNGAARRAGPDPLSRCERKILTAAAQIDGQVGSPSEEVLLLLTGYRPSGSWNEALASLRSSGFLDGTSITEDGALAIGRLDPLPRGDALVSYWEQKLGRCPGAILRYLVENTGAGEAIAEDDVREATGYRPSGSWNEALSDLRKLHLLAPRGDLCIPDDTRRLLVVDA